MLRILDWGHSVPTVTELTFVRAQWFTNFAIKAFYTLRNNNWVKDPVIVPQGVKCFNNKIGKTLRSHKCQF